MPVNPGFHFPASQSARRCTQSPDLRRAAVPCPVAGSNQELNLYKPSVIKVRTVSSTAYLLQGEEKSILIDTLSPRRGWQLLRQLRKKGVDLSRISLILLTHGHIDHFGNALRLKRELGAPVAIHEFDAEAVRMGRNMRLHPRNLYERVLGSMVKHLKTDGLEPDILLTGEEGGLEEFGVAARWVRTPGHSEGSISVVLPGESVIVGDLVIGKFSLLKKPAYPLWVKDGQQVRDSVRKLLEYQPSTFLSGHGGPLDPAEVRKVFLKEGGS